MRDEIFWIELLNIDTNTKFRQQLKSNCLTFDLIIDIIESYYPEIDTQTLTIYYYRNNLWNILLYDDKFDLEEGRQFGKETDQLIFKVRFHCYILEMETEKHIMDDICIINEKIEKVQNLYSQLKEKFNQEALDINVFWGSPSYANDGIQRSKKPNIDMINSEGKELNLLNQRVKYQPFVEAVNIALEKCQKKVHLEINHLNKESFTDKNIFTIVYLIAHLQLDENQQKKKRNEEGQKKKPSNKKNFIEKQNNERQFVINTSKLQKQRSQPSVVLKKANSFQKGDDLDLIIQQTTSVQNNDQNQEYKSQKIQQRMLPIPKMQKGNKQQFSQVQSKNELLSHNSNSSSSQFQKKKMAKIQSIKEIVPDQLREKQKYQSSKFKPNYNSYLLGQQTDGSLCKIYPADLQKIFKQLSRKIQLLILHTSYPYNHLQEFKKYANNIILINSNPLVPEPSTIFYIKQLFTYLLKYGNIRTAYEKSMKDMNILQQISTHDEKQDVCISISEQLNKEDIEYINHINKLYVHGSMSCCCCYHPHDKRCHSNSNQSPSKYAQYHYRYHSNHCNCIMSNFNIHSCQAKKQYMTNQFRVLNSQYSSYQKNFYYCCCSGFEEGYYQDYYHNKYMKDEEYRKNKQMDIHSLFYKYNFFKEMEGNAEDNQFLICEGRLQGDISQQLSAAFKYIEQNPIIGNRKLIVKLLQIYTIRVIGNSSRMYQNQDLIICNLFGDKSSGKKTIAKYFCNMLLAKKLFKRIVIKTFNKQQDIKNIVQNSYKQTESRPIFILIHQNHDIYDKSALSLNHSHFDRNANIIIITQQKIYGSSLNISYQSPQPFQNSDCINFVKKYRHLTTNAKRNVQKIFELAARSSQRGRQLQLFPCSINQFQILNIINRTNFNDYRIYASAISRLSQKSVQFYVFIMSMMKFTRSPCLLKSNSMKEVMNNLKIIQNSKSLFLKDYDTKFKQKYQYFLSRGPEKQLEYYYQIITSLSRAKDHYPLIFLCNGQKIRTNIVNLFKLFIHYTTVEPVKRSYEESKNKIDLLRIKNTPFSQQLYEATTINPDSYIVRYFSEQLRSVEQLDLSNQQQFDIEAFLRLHAELFQIKRSSKRNSTDTVHYNTKPKQKERDKKQIDHSLELLKQSRSKYDQSDKYQQPLDIPNIYHLASIIQAGLQYLRNIMCTHFIYSTLKLGEKIQLLKFAVLLVNNCIILMKNKAFLDIEDQKFYDFEATDEQFRQSHQTERIYDSTHNFDVPNLKYMKSQEIQSIPQLSQRSYTTTQNKSELFSSQKLIQTAQKSVKKKQQQKSDNEQTSQITDILLKQLSRLSNYKGLLYLLGQIERKAEQIRSDQIVKVKMQTQLLAIQIRLQQIQFQQIQTKMEYQRGDRHLQRIANIFMDKNYNMSALYRILKDQSTMSTMIDSTELGIIKSYIIIALSLTASSYGRFKLIRAKSMIDEIRRFIQSWNYDVPLCKRQSQQCQSETSNLTNSCREQKKKQIDKCQNVPQFAFMRFISQNESVYIQIVNQSFSSTKFWESSIKKYNQCNRVKLEKKKSQLSKKHEQNNEDQIQIYLKILTLYRLFQLKNTKNKYDYYTKLQKVKDSIMYYKNMRRFTAFSAYIINFVKTFEQHIAKQFQHLKPFQIMIFNADDSKNYIKVSLKSKLNSFISKTINNPFFNIKNKLNYQSINRVISNKGSKYLCIFTGAGQNNIKEDIIIQTAEGKFQIGSKDKLADALSRVSCNTIFIGLPLKKMLAEELIRFVHQQRSIVYFDFTQAKFQIIKSNNKREDICLFQKLIMIETVNSIVCGIMEEYLKGYHNNLIQSFRQAKFGLSFVLTGNKNEPLMKISNQQFRKCLFIQHNEVVAEQINQVIRFKEIQLQQRERVKPEQLQELKKISRLMQSDQKEYFQFKIDNSIEIKLFVEVFTFYFKDKFGFKQIYSIQLDNLLNNRHQMRRGDNETQGVKNNFRQKLVDERILDLIFSDKKGIIILYFQASNGNGYQKILDTCQNQLKSILKSCDQLEGNRQTCKFYGKKMFNSKNVKCTLILFLHHSQQVITE